MNTGLKTTPKLVADAIQWWSSTKIKSLNISGFGSPSREITRGHVDYPISLDSSKEQLFALGVTHCKKFCAANKIASPSFYTFEQVLSGPEGNLKRHLTRLIDGPKQGYGTGWYFDNNVFVNLKKAAKLQREPRFQNWSFPGYRVDRTPFGVCAHEVGHHIDHVMGGSPIDPEFVLLLENAENSAAARRHAVNLYYSLFSKSPSSSPLWAKIVQNSRPIASYEPNLAESLAETLRLFINNPDLLFWGNRSRYDFVTGEMGLKANVHYSYNHVLGNHQAYCDQAFKWMRAN